MEEGASIVTRLSGECCNETANYSCRITPSVPPLLFISDFIRRSRCAGDVLESCIALTFWRNCSSSSRRAPDAVTCFCQTTVAFEADGDGLDFCGCGAAVSGEEQPEKKTIALTVVASCVVSCGCIEVAILVLGAAVLAGAIRKVGHDWQGMRNQCERLYTKGRGELFGPCSRLTN